MTSDPRLDRLGVLLLCGSALVLALLVTLAAVSGQKNARSPSDQVVILVDATDRIPIEDAEALVAWLRGLEDSDLRQGTEVSMWVLGDGPGGALERRFFGRYPGRKANPLLQNPGQLAISCDSSFTGPLAASVRAIPSMSPAGHSPLLAAIRQLAEQSELAEKSIPRRLVLVSDLEENSTSLSFYRTQPDFSAFSKSGLFPSVRTDLRGVVVDVLYLPRGRAATMLTPDLTEFARQYLHACGASSVRIRRL